ncbi:PH domain-containing protein [Corynebacterium kroppenstedtii]|uniref:PH domain-containing protein n=1 Tax=Corynebacterium sp. PCR 32 TaxID=3351342 RepID=UPI0030AC4861
MSSTPSGEHTPGSHSPPTDTVTFHPDRMNLLGAGVMFLICLMFVGYHPAYLFWVLIVPIMFAAWILRARTALSPHGITAHYLFRRSRTIRWDELSGIQFSRSGRAYAARTTSPTRATLTDANTASKNAKRNRPSQKRDTIALPGVTFNHLPKLSQASGGRIPDPVTPGKKHDEDELHTVNRDGYAVITTQEEATREHNARLIAAEMTRRRATHPDHGGDAPEPSHRGETDNP